MGEKGTAKFDLLWVAYAEARSAGREPDPSPDSAEAWLGFVLTEEGTATVKERMERLSTERKALKRLLKHARKHGQFSGAQPAAPEPSEGAPAPVRRRRPRVPAVPSGAAPAAVPVTKGAGNTRRKPAAATPAAEPATSNRRGRKPATEPARRRKTAAPASDTKPAKAAPRKVSSRTARQAQDGAPAGARSRRALTPKPTRPAR